MKKIKRDNTYTIEKLIDELSKQHKKILEDYKDLNKKIESGEVEFQEWMKETFSICLALKELCKEIKKINNYLDLDKTQS